MGQICQDNSSIYVEFRYVSRVKPTAVLRFSYSRDLSDLNVTFPTPTADWTPDNGYPSNATADSLPRRAFGAGAHLGLTLFLNVEADEFYCSPAAGVGFKVKNVTSN
jgi:amiloride-sensitive sodium channel